MKSLVFRFIVIIAISVILHLSLSINVVVLICLNSYHKLICIPRKMWASLVNFPEINFIIVSNKKYMFQLFFASLFVVYLDNYFWWVVSIHLYVDSVWSTKSSRIKNQLSIIKSRQILDPFWLLKCRKKLKSFQSSKLIRLKYLNFKMDNLVII